ncbi:MAG: hypothetical protein RLY31_1890 [Bacteroidota bacterium]
MPGRSDRRPLSSGSRRSCSNRSAAAANCCAWKSSFACCSSLDCARVEVQSRRSDTTVVRHRCWNRLFITAIVRPVGCSWVAGHCNREVYRGSFCRTLPDAIRTSAVVFLTSCYFPGCMVCGTPGLTITCSTDSHGTTMICKANCIPKRYCYRISFPAAPFIGCPTQGESSEPEMMRALASASGSGRGFNASQCSLPEPHKTLFRDTRGR